MSYRSRRNEAKHKQLALLYTLATITALLALGYYFSELTEVGEWLQFFIGLELPPEAAVPPVAGV